MTLRARTGELWARMGNIVRRLLVQATADPLRWLVTGHLGEGGDEEADDLELFAGVGVAARPAKGVTVEALACAVNGGDQHVIVATRAPDTLLAVTGKVGLDHDETVIWTSKSVVKITADGDVLIGRIGGAVKPVALADHTHELPQLVGDTGYGEVLGPTETGPCTANSTDTKVT